MARYTAAQIYAFAREAGFSPDQATTMTAIALAESGGKSTAHNPHGEDSQGLWQINREAHGHLTDLYDPLTNAKAAFEVSKGGQDISPWTVTHGDLTARYLRYRSEAEAAAMAYGDGEVHGNWTGVSGYGDREAAGDPGGDAPGRDRGPGDSGDAAVVNTSAVEQQPQAAQTGENAGLALEEPGAGGVEQVSNTSTEGEDVGIALEGAAPEPEPEPAVPTPGQVSAPGDGTAVQAFVNAALSQEGDQYIFGAEVKDLDNPNPSAFDCSELVEWAAHQTGVTVPDGAVYQYRHLNEAGTTMSVEQAINTPGALLFSFSTDPLTGRPSAAHVAISLGDGRTIEAMGDAYGVTEGSANTERFQYAGYIPEFGTNGAPVQPIPDAPPADAFGQRLDSDPADLDGDPQVVKAAENLTEAPPPPPPPPESAPDESSDAVDLGEEEAVGLGGEGGEGDPDANADEEDGGGIRVATELDLSTDHVAYDPALAELAGLADSFDTFAPDNLPGADFGGNGDSVTS